MLPTIAREGDVVVMIDQRKLPSQEVYVRCKTAAEVARAIKTMVIRGAPAIGVAAAWGIAIGMRRSTATGTQKFAAEFQKTCDLMAATRPTAVNLFWAIERMKRRFGEALGEVFGALGVGATQLVGQARDVAGGDGGLDQLGIRRVARCQLPELDEPALARREPGCERRGGAHRQRRRRARLAAGRVLLGKGALAAKAIDVLVHGGPGHAHIAGDLLYGSAVFQALENLGLALGEPFADVRLSLRLYIMT